MYRYVAYYKYDALIEAYYYDGDQDVIVTELTEDEISEINDLFDSDPNMNPMINNVFRNSVIEKRIWSEVPIELGNKIKGWNWKLKNKEKGYVEILAEEPLTQEELNIMSNKTKEQISDGYNENPFNFRLKSGKRYGIVFHYYPITDFKEE